jgi:hypothetical protein
MNKAGQAVTGKKNPGTEANTNNVLLDKLLKGEDIFETVETAVGTFKIKYPRPADFRKIQILLSSRFPGIDLNNIKDRDATVFEIYATLDVVVVEAPQWWDGLESSEMCPDEGLINKLNKEYLRLYKEIQSKVNGNYDESGNDIKKQHLSDKKETVDTGAFSDITNG